ncbi:hemolysin family protein [Heyndrickxia ginsengihumi]|uniref:HlyC/CorC family transporter n=1 Tax=Heyndrickxia ginsengihumi TaxID=363870 RepID=A0A6M0P4W5_9BACI|nr:hemolysin family protein [Heyndrickxia ginsengihumi]MBE6184572.1 HlyC/CorC family transporter [Bacillus sp. (in: firmicutes)]MCM3022126.1 hemolysin family protein [Heyndrickxia ginsengihumi]NEY18358.1 HlyC/CorC family transporter [Heyndrickxia ginsengihumi]
MDIFKLVLIFILIALSAFFVASEFAIVKVRSSRIDQLIEEGNRKAITVKKLLSNLDEYLSTCQLGITIISLLLGWIGEETVSTLLDPLFEIIGLPHSVTTVVSVFLSFAIITLVHVVIGELAPKTIAIQKAEQIIFLASRPLMIFHRIMYPFIWILNSSAGLVTKMTGFEPASENDVAHTEEELRIILSESYKNGEINQSEFKYVNKIFEFDNRIAKEIMVPRTEVVSLSKDDSLESFLELVQQERFTRYPVIDGDKDHIIGIVNLKEVLTDLLDQKNGEKPTIQSYVRPIIRVIETIPINDLLIMMQKERIHMAVLLDEYGGTSGIATVEDILEEIVGEIRDEFDMDEVPLIRKVQENHYIIDSKVLISEVNDLLGTHISDEEVDTIGGWVLTENYEAKQGDIIQSEGFDFIIKDMEDLHVKYIEVKKHAFQEVKREAQPPIPLTNSKVLS